MVDYQKLYAILCGAASDAIDALDRENIGAARLILERALDQTETLYLDSDTNSDTIS